MHQKSPDGTGGCHSTTCTGPGGEHGDNEAITVVVKDACTQLCRVRHPFSGTISNQTPDLSHKQEDLLDSCSICSTGESNIVHMVKATLVPCFSSCGKKCKSSIIILLQSH